MANKRKTTIDGNKVAAIPPTEQNGEVHVCCYDEGGFYFAADLSGFIIDTFHDIGDLCAWILDYERVVSSKDSFHLVIHSHKPAVMRPHPVLEDLDEGMQQRILADLENRGRE